MFDRQPLRLQYSNKYRQNYIYYSWTPKTLHCIISNVLPVRVVHVVTNILKHFKCTCAHRLAFQRLLKHERLLIIIIIRLIITCRHALEIIQTESISLRHIFEITFVIKKDDKTLHGSCLAPSPPLIWLFHSFPFSILYLAPLNLNKILF